MHDELRIAADPEVLDRITVRVDAVGGKSTILNSPAAKDHVLTVLSFGNTAKAILRGYALLDLEDTYAYPLFAH